MQALLHIAYKKGVLILNNLEVDKITDTKFPPKLAIQVYKGIVDWLNEIQRQRIQ